jgi:hypothetical protein
MINRKYLFVLLIIAPIVFLVLQCLLFSITGQRQYSIPDGSCRIETISGEIINNPIVIESKRELMRTVNWIGIWLSTAFIAIFILNIKKLELSKLTAILSGISLALLSSFIMTITYHEGFDSFAVLFFFIIHLIGFGIFALVYKLISLKNFQRTSTMIFLILFIVIYLLFVFLVKANEFKVLGCG